MRWSPLTFSESQFQQKIFFDNHFYLVKVNTNGFNYSKKNNTAIFKYDINLKQVNASFQNLKYGKKKSVFTKLIAIEDDLCILTTAVDKGSKDKKLILYKLDTTTLLPVEIPLELLRAEKNSIFSSAQFHVVQSKDSKFTLFIAETSPPPEQPRKFQFILLDNKSNILLNKFISFPKTKKKFQFVDAKIDNQGNVFIAGFQNAITSTKFLAKCLLYQFNLETKKNTIQVFENEESKYFKGFHFDINSDSIFLAGYYSEKEKHKRSIKGIFYASMPKFHNQTPKFEYQSISTKILSKAKGNKLIATKQIKELDGLWIENVLNWNNEYILIIGERRFTVSGGQNAANRIYIENVVIVCLNKFGKIIWEQVVHKNHEYDP